MNQEVFESYSVPRAVFTMSVPTMLSMLVTIFYNMADTLFVGWTGDPNQVAAVSLATPVFMIFMAFGNIFGIGGSSLISRLLGEGNPEKTKHVSAFCFYGCIVIGILASLLLMWQMPLVLKLIGCSENTIDFAESYLRCIAFGGYFIVISNAFGNVVRGEGAAKASMIGMMTGTIINIILDPIMILGLDMGVAGAAIATIIGNICATIYYILYFITRKDKTLLSIAPKYFQLNDGILTGVLFVGIPVFLNNMLMTFANIMLNNVLSSYGDAPVAAMGVAMKANMLVFMLQMGLAMGIQPLVGYAYGNRNIEKQKKIMKFAAMCTFILGTTLTVVYYLFTEPIIRFFISDTDVIYYGIKMLRALMIAGPIVGIFFIFNFSFQAMGKALASLLLTLSRQGFVFLPVLLIGNRLLGLDGAVYAQSVADIASILISVCMFLFIMKKEDKKKV
jgi:putative MATE family efflux protein